MDVVKPYDLSPTEFEKYCVEIFKGYGEKENLRDFEVTHNVKLPAHNGIYQIDLYAKFTALGETAFKVLCECKRYRSRVNRDTVVLLADKVKSLGAQKGILISTSAFQKGAIQYAKENGIALIQMTERGPEHYSYSSGSQELNENDPFRYGEKQLPLYRAFDVTRDPSDAVVYPTASMMDEIFATIKRMIKESALHSK
jgi:hypothetical protein